MTVDNIEPPFLKGGAEEATPLSAALAELARHDATVRDAILQRLHEQSEYLLTSGQKKLTKTSSGSAESERPVNKEFGPERTESVTVSVAEFLSRPVPEHPKFTIAPACAATLVFAAFCYAICVGAPHHAVSAGHASNTWENAWSDVPGWRYAQYMFCGLLTWSLTRDLRRGMLAEAWAVARQLTLFVVLQNLLVMIVTVLVGLTLRHFIPALDRSWLYLIPGSHGAAMNLGVLPAHIKYFGIVFLLLFAVSIPKLARSEEKDYREGTRNWGHGVRRSLRFGLAHCVVGVPIYAGLALTVGGLWFTHQYFKGGVERSTLHHAAYNWIVAAAGLAAVTVWSLS